MFYFWHSLAISVLMVGSFFWGKNVGEKRSEEKVKG
jgi:hypothetical protein